MLRELHVVPSRLALASKAQLKTAVVTSLFLMFGICFHMLGQSKVAPRNKRSKSHWHVFSPADRSFTIETPKPLRYFKDPEDKWLEVYGSAASELEACQSQYSVAVGTLDDKDRPNGDLSGWRFLIGGSHTDPTSETDILVEGRKAKDIIYTKAFDSGCKYRRGWIIDGGTRIYWLIYQDDELKNLSSPSTMRFLKSFHLRTKRLTIHSS